jgi:hypothetical protein
MESILDLIRFLNSNPKWLFTLGLKSKIDGELYYKVPDRSTFYKFANGLRPDNIVQIFSVMVVDLLRLKVIKGGKVSLDCSIIRAWFYDCKHAKSPNTTTTTANAKKHRHRDKDASWEWDHTPSREVHLWIQGPHSNRFFIRFSDHAHCNKSRIWRGIER